MDEENQDKLLSYEIPTEPNDYPEHTVDPEALMRAIDAHSTVCDVDVDGIDPEDTETFGLIKPESAGTNQANHDPLLYLMFPRRSRDSWGPEILTDSVELVLDPDASSRRDTQALRPGCGANYLRSKKGPGGRDDERRKKITDSLCERDALKPVRVFSFNHHVPVINLSDGSQTKLFFTSGHLAVIYDVKKNHQHILRGHVNTIVCTCASVDRRWLGSGDRGPNSAVIIWDAHKYMAIRTMVDTHPNGVVAIQLTPDARYLATLSADDVNQVFAMWNWTRPCKDPICYTLLSADYGTQTKIAFKDDDYFHVMTNSESHVIFYDWKTIGCMESYSPKLKRETFCQNYGKFVMSTYLPTTGYAITVTTKGFAVLWEKSRKPKKVRKFDPMSDSYYNAWTTYDEETCFKSPAKLIPLHKCAITFITITSCVSSKIAIVTGDETGQIRFSDRDFKLLYWYNDFRYGRIASIGFSDKGLFNDGLETFKGRRYSKESHISQPPFVIEDFIASTSQAVLLTMRVEGKVVKLLEREQHATVNDVAAHPHRDLVTTVGHSGMVKTWNYRWLIPIRTRIFEGQKLNACAFDPYGVYLAVGFTSGRVMILDAITLNDANEVVFDYARGVVTRITFSSDSKFCAYIDTHRSTTLLRRGELDSEENHWVFSGRYRAHGADVVDIMFKRPTKLGPVRLFTIGSDRMLVEYDVHHAAHNVLPIKSRIQIEQIALPLCFTSMGDFYSDEYICFANSESKIRLISAENLTIRKTVMAPLQGAKYVRIATLPEKDDFPTPPSTPSDLEKSADKNCLVFLTNERLGLVLVPLDGDPYKATNIIAHPSEERGTAYASGLAVSRDRRFIFTTGGPDNSMHMWRTDPGVLVAQTHLYDDPMQPFYDMLSPEMFNDMKDYFYLSMIRVQGLTCMDTRMTSLTNPISEIPFLVRALGFYASDVEIENMLREVQYSHFHRTGRYETEIDFDTFVKLYLNHRDPYGMMSMTDIEEAFVAIERAQKPHQNDCPFKDLCQQNKKKVVLERTCILRLLQTIGEPIRHNELVETLAVLLGLAPEAGNIENICAMKDLKVSKEIEERLPQCFTAKGFYDSMLAMDLCRELPQLSMDIGRETVNNPVRSAVACQTEI